jgi:hypothetical protein
MSDSTQIPGASLEAYNAASGEGWLAATLFLQSLEDHGCAMNHEEAGGALLETVEDEIVAFQKAENQEVGFGRLSGFMCAIGAALWWSSKERRERAASAQPELAQQPKPARVVSLALVGAKKARAGKGAKDGG